MRALVAIFVAVIFCATVSNALDEDPLEMPPYCLPSTNFTTANGTYMFDDYYNSNAAAIFMNGRDPDDLSGYGLDHELWDWTSFGIADWFYGPSDPEVGLPNQEPDAVSWGIIDGTSDTFDIGLSFSGYVNGDGLSFTQGNVMCGQSEQSVVVSAQSFGDVAIELQFYAPTGNTSSWARSAMNMKNNGQASADVTAILVNNWGSDEDTMYLVIDDHYTCSADDADVTAASDPLLCYYWKSAGNKASPFWWNNTAPVNQSELVMPSWNLTLAAGQSLTILQFASQNSKYNWTELQAEAAWINSNPIHIYAALPQSYLTSLANFDLCNATFTPSPSVQTACAMDGGKATFKLDTYPELSSLSPTLKIGDTTLDLTSDATVDLAAGTYDVSYTFGGCPERALPQVTVTCPAAPIAPMASPVAAPIAAPVAKKASASSVGTAVVGWAVVLGALLY